MPLFHKKFQAVLMTATILASRGAIAGQLPASAFQPYNPATASTITPGPFALYSVAVDSIMPTQLNEGFTEVGKKAAGFDLLAPSQLQSNLLTSIEPVVIGPNGQLYLTDGHHTFTALQDSSYGASDPTVFIDVIANYSGLTESQFLAQMEANNLLFPVNDGVFETVNLTTGAPLPASLTGLTSDVYRGLEYSILKNKSSKLFTTANNLTGAIGSSIPGLDKMTGFYSDFIWADAYRNANNGLGLPYLSPGDIALATKWNLNGNSTTSMPGVGNVTVAQLPGYILGANITVSSTISNATLSTGTLDGNGNFTGITSFTFGNATTGMVTVGTPQVGFIMQLGWDSFHNVTLSGNNTYTGGTSILAGDLIITSDQSLGAAAPGNITLSPGNITAQVQADNGIVFNSLTEGNGTLQIGTASGAGTATFATNRPIAVGGETATLNLNGYIVTLTGPLASTGADGGLSSQTGEADLTIDDNSSNKGVLILSTPSPLFYGDIIIGNNNKPTVRVMSDAALGNTTLPANELGQVVLNGGTFQAGASFTSQRTFAVDSNSTVDTNGFTTSFGNLTDTQRDLTITNSAGNTTGNITFASFQVASAMELTINSAGNATTNVTFADGIIREGTAQILLNPSSGVLGQGQNVFAGGIVVVNNGIVSPWLVVDSGGSAPTSPYQFATYGATGYVAYGNYTTTLSGNGSAATVYEPTGNTTLGNATITNVAAYALDVQNSRTITLSGNTTLSIGDGVNPAGLIFNGGSSGIFGGNLAFGGSEAVIAIKGSSSITSAITGTGGISMDGTGTLTISTASTETGLITINSGNMVLSASNVFSASTQGVLLQDTKHLATANLTLSSSNEFAALNSAGSNSFVIITGTGTQLTIGDSNNLSSTLSSTISDSTVTQGVITKNGTGLLDLSGMSGSGLNLAAGSSIVVNGGQLRVAASIFKNTNNIVLGNGTEVQFAQSGGGVFGGNITGNGTLHLIGGTLELSSSNNTYSGGSIVEIGSTLDTSTATISSTNANITDAGGLIVFDQNFSGNYTGVISDGRQMEATTGPLLSGSLDKDDSSGQNGGNLILTQVQAYSGMTYVEAGNLTLGVANAILSSDGVDLGRVGGNSTASLVLAANNTISNLNSEASDNTSVQLGNFTLTVNQTAATNFRGNITGTGNLVLTGTGILTLSGTNTYSGGTVINGGVLSIASDSALGNISGNLSFNGGVLQTTANVTSARSITLGGAGGIDTDGNTDTLSGNITGPGDLVVMSSTGNGTLILSGNNSYSGGTMVVSGTLEANAANALPNGGALVVQNPGTLNLNGFSTTASALSGNGTVALGAANLTIAGGNTSSSFSGVIGGTGGLIISSGMLTLSGNNTYTGGTALNGGILAINSDAALGNSTGNVTFNGGELQTIANVTSARGIVLAGNGGIDTDGNTDTLSGTISGPGALTVTSSVTGGVLILTGNNTYSGGTVLDGGTLSIASDSALGNSSGPITFNGGKLQTTANVTSARAIVLAGNGSIDSDGKTETLTGNISGPGAITVTSSTAGGVLILDGVDTYTGGTTVAGGVLEIGDASHAGASIKGPVTVSSGGTLSGHGTVFGNVAVNTGGTIQPGGTIGTLSVGNVTFASASTYVVEANAAGASDLIAASGSATLGNAAVAVTPDGNATTYTRVTTYTVLTASSVNGAFGHVTSSASTLTPFLYYSGTNVTLKLVRNDISLATLGTTANEMNIGAALSAGGPASTLWDDIAPLPDATVSAALDPLSGEIHASLTSVLAESQGYMSGAIMSRLLEDPPAEPAAVWGSADGSWNTLNGNGNAAGVTYNTYGMVVGLDVGAGDQSRLGVAIGYANDTAEVSARASSALANSIGGAIYGETTSGQFHLRADLGYSSLSIHTTRNITVPDTEALTAHYGGQGWFGSGEFSYSIDASGLDIEPLVDVDVTELDTNGFTETGGLAALSGLPHNQTLFSTVLGGRLSETFDNGSGTAWTPRLMLGWRNTGNFVPSVVETFESTNQSFIAYGAPLSNNALVASAGVTLAIGQQVKFDVSYVGQFGDRETDGSVKATLGINF